MKQLGQLFPIVMQQVSNFSLNADFLLGGFTEDGQARLAHVSNPGQLTWVDGMDFFAIGSGMSHTKCARRAR